MFETTWKSGFISWADVQQIAARTPQTPIATNAVPVSYSAYQPPAAAAPPHRAPPAANPRPSPAPAPAPIAAAAPTPPITIRRFQA